MVIFSNEFSLPHKLTHIQEQVFVGGMLGDAALEFSSKARFPRMKIDRKAEDKKYLLWQFNIFKNLCTETAFKEYERYDERYDKFYKQVSFRTRAVPAFKPFYLEWYGTGKKAVPNDFEFTPLIAAIWFADDGCIIQTGKNALTLKMSTDGFGEAGAGFLAEKLEKLLGYTFPIYQKKKGKDLWVIKTSTKPAIAFIEYINPLFNFGMIRKSNVWTKFIKPCKRIHIIDNEVKNSIDINYIQWAIYSLLIHQPECDVYDIQEFLVESGAPEFSTTSINTQCSKLINSKILTKDRHHPDDILIGMSRNMFSLTAAGRRAAKEYIKQINTQ